MVFRPTTSIIVATYGREQVLRETLGRLLDLTYSDYELLVIDQTAVHEPETIDFLHGCTVRYPTRFRWHHIEGPGLPRARNIGALLAAGRYLLYCDDDIIPPADLVEKHMENLQRPGVGAVTGGIRIARRRYPVQHSPCSIFPNGRMVQYWDYHVSKGTTDSLLGCNMSMPRELAIRIGLFDEGYIGRANWEETDLSVRIRRYGLKIVYDPAAAVVHLGHQTGGVRASRDTDVSRYYYESHYNNAYFFAKNIRQRYLPWMLKRELGWILVKQAVGQGAWPRTLPSLRGIGAGYLAGRRARKNPRTSSAHLQRKRQ